MYPDRKHFHLGLLSLKQTIDSYQESALTIALDIETTGLTPYEDRVTWISWCTAHDNFGAIPIRHRNPLTPPELEIEVRAIVKEIHKRENTIIVWHNAAFDLTMLISADWLALDDINEGSLFDTMLASYVLNPVKKNEGGSHRLKELYDEHVRDPNQDPVQPTFENISKGKDFEEVSEGDAAWYAGFDAWTTFSLFKIFKPQLTKENLDHYFYKIEMLNLLTTIEIQTSGFRLVDQSQVVAAEKQRSLSDLKREYEDVKNKVFEILDTTFNFESPESMRKALFYGPYGIYPRGRKITSGKFNLDKTALAQMLCDQIHNFRNSSAIAYILYAKQLASSIAKHEEMYGYLNKSKNKIFPNISPLTSSGRYFASRPNTLSLNTSSNIKSHIIPENGKIFVIGDFSQIDLRVIANETDAITQNNSMVTHVNSGVDLHLNTLKIVNKRVKENWKCFQKDGNGDVIGVIDITGHPICLTQEELDSLPTLKKSRHEIAKPINFGISYGLGPTKLQENLNNTDEFREQVLSLPKANKAALPAEQAKVDEEWINKIRSIVKPEEEISLEEVTEYLSRFHETYPDIQKFQDAILNELVKSGKSFNIFGRCCRAELIPYLAETAIDLRLADGRWYRVWIKKISVEKTHISCEILRVSRLKVTDSSCSKNSKISDLEIEEESEIYRVNGKQLENLWQAFQNNQDPDALIDGLLLLHEESSWDTDNLFDFIKAVSPTHLTKNNIIDRPLYPYVKIPHSMIARVQAGDNNSLSMRPFVEYPGFDRIRRKLISQRVSSTSMDFCKIAMFEFRKWAKQEWPSHETRPKIINCIHDEIAVECAIDDGLKVKAALKNIMRDRAMFSRYIAPGKNLAVEMDADVKCDSNYGKAKP